MKRLLTALTLLLLSVAAHGGIFRSGGPATTDNDASCDISQLPAATLLLPYFEVDLVSPAGTGETTIFTVTNTTEVPQIAHVTLWTDYAYPVLDFNIFLTGYDVQSINLYDVIRRGQIAPSDGTGFDVSPVGELSGNPATRTPRDNAGIDERSCVNLPVQLPQVLITRMQSVFTTGKVPGVGTSPACNTAGGVHQYASGYATIDVVGACTATFATESAYFTDLIRYDNVLTGDYAQINGGHDFAQGGPLVHIRATPEGGTPQTRVGNSAYRVHAPRTFYSRFLPAGGSASDARQPLPSAFHARWISGGTSGFESYLKVWREGRSSSSTACSAYPAANGAMGISELVRFDEEENPSTLVPRFIGPPLINAPVLPAASMVNPDNEVIFPPNSEGAVSGWLYLDLDVSKTDAFASQAWIITSLRAEDRYSVDADATALGNGCSAPFEKSNAYQGNTPIGPAPNVRP